MLRSSEPYLDDKVNFTSLATYLKLCSTLFALQLQILYTIIVIHKSLITEHDPGMLMQS